MNKIVVDTDREYAPCSYLICHVDSMGNYNTRDESTIVLDSDWDYPGVARLFGWTPCHDGTDGTVDCPECGRTASGLITAAADVIDAHLGEVVEDTQGYFGTEE